ncbi:MAG TPA: NAD-binding protein [Planctomycetota bacterium]|jgi:voltage-gated potassium channel Kch
MRRRKHSWILFAWRYAVALLREFRWTLVGLAAAILFGALLYSVLPPKPGEKPISFDAGLFNAWMAMLAQPQQPEVWYFRVLCGFYPVVGFVLVGEGIVRLAMLITSRQQGEKEWMIVMASTYRNHIILCGLGHLGFRVLQELHRNSVPVVALEKDGEGRFVSAAKALGIPILLRDIKEDQALIDAGIQEARAIIIATNDDMANLEVALDARRMKPDIRIFMRLFDQQIAAKIFKPLNIDTAFSASALAAPIISAMVMDATVMATYQIGGTAYVAVDVVISERSALAGKSLTEIEKSHSARVVARTSKNGACQTPPPADAKAVAGDRLVVHLAAEKLTALAADSKLKD